MNFVDIAHAGSGDLIQRGNATRKVVQRLGTLQAASRCREETVALSFIEKGEIDTMQYSSGEQFAFHDLYCSARKKDSLDVSRLA